jgi:voltage-gated potassium channel
VALGGLGEDLMDRLERWQRRTEWPLAGCAIIFMTSYAWAVLQPGLPTDVKTTLTAIDYLTWAFFVIDYVVRVSMAHPRGTYVLRNVADLLMLALPVLRPLRLLRLLILLKILNRRAIESLHGRVIIYAAATSTLVVFSAALAELDAERGHSGAHIETFGASLWWSVATLTTVGYGDYYPVTTQGRFVAVGLMLAGIAVLGVVTASFATWLIERVRATDIETAAATRRDIYVLHDEIAALTQLVSRLEQRLSADLDDSARQPIGRR